MHPQAGPQIPEIERGICLGLNSGGAMQDNGTCHIFILSSWYITLNNREHIPLYSSISMCYITCYTQAGLTDHDVYNTSCYRTPLGPWPDSEHPLS